MKHWMCAVSAAFFVTSCAPPTTQAETRDEVILVQSWLEYDSQDGKLLGYSSSEERVARENSREAVLERATSEGGPDAIQICETETAERRHCELVFFTEDWRNSEPLRREADRNTI